MKKLIGRRLRTFLTIALLLLPICALAQFDSFPVSRLQRLQLKAPFTITYRYTDKFVTLPPGTTGKKPAPETRLLTVSANQDTVLLLKSNLVGKLTEVELYDGEKTYAFNTSSSMAQIYLGLDMNEMRGMPLPGLGIPYDPLMIKDASSFVPSRTITHDQQPASTQELLRFISDTPNYLSGTVKNIPGASQDLGTALDFEYAPNIQKVFYSLALAGSVMQSGQIKVLWLALQGADTPSELWEFDQHQKFQGMWLASRISYAHYISSPGTHTYLLSKANYELVRAVDQPLTPEAYSFSHYLHSGVSVNDYTAKAIAAYPFNSRHGSLEQQKLRQQVLDQEERSRAEHGNILGGIAIQTLVLCLLDFRIPGKHPLTYQAASLVLVLEGILVVAVLIVAIMGTQMPCKVSFLHLAPQDLLIFFFWIGGVWLLSKARTDLPWQEKGDAPGGEQTEDMKRHKEEEEKKNQKAGIGKTVALFLTSSAVTLVAGFVLEETGTGIAGHIHLTGVLFGATVLAAATSLPEISTGLASIKMGDYQLAVSDIFGGNAFLPVLFLPATLLSGSSVLPQAKDTDIYLAGLGILLTAVYLYGLIFRPRRLFLRMGADSIVVLLLYGLGIASLFTIAHAH